MAPTGTPPPATAPDVSLRASSPSSPGTTASSASISSTSSLHQADSHHHRRRRRRRQQRAPAPTYSSTATRRVPRLSQACLANRHRCSRRLGPRSPRPLALCRRRLQRQLLPDLRQRRRLPAGLRRQHRADITAVGGTSASSPAFAGIMALVNQKYGRQGQADFVLYPLATQFPAAFHDVTVGTNSVPCSFSPTIAQLHLRHQPIHDHRSHLRSGDRRSDRNRHHSRVQRHRRL